MRLTVSVFWISLLLGFDSNAQRDIVYKGLDKALAVPADSVYRLDLSKQKLTELPKDILQFKNLQELNLSKNKLTHIPSWFYFEDLRTLDISRNKLETFSESITKCSSIRNLFLGKNQIKTFPESIGNMANLIVLDVWFNPLEDLPESMTQLRNLRALDLSGISFNKEQQQKWSEMLHWVKIEFEATCDCQN